MLIEGGIYNRKQDDRAVVIVKIDPDCVFGFDIGYYSKTIDQTFLRNELFSWISYLEDGTANHNLFWHAAEADSIVDGYLGKVDTYILNILKEELHYSYAYQDMQEIRNN